MPSNARHAVWTLINTMMTGIHFYYHTTLQRSLCGWVSSKFTSEQVTNAEHDEFLSIIQSFATFWAPAFKHTGTPLADDDDGTYYISLRVPPYHDTDHSGLDHASP